MGLQLFCNKGSSKRLGDEFARPFLATRRVHTLGCVFAKKIGLATFTTCLKLAIVAGYLFMIRTVNVLTTDSTRRVGYWNGR